MNIEFYNQKVWVTYFRKSIWHVLDRTPPKTGIKTHFFHNFEIRLLLFRIKPNNLGVMCGNVMLTSSIDGGRDLPRILKKLRPEYECGGHFSPIFAFFCIFFLFNITLPFITFILQNSTLSTLKKFEKFKNNMHEVRKCCYCFWNSDFIFS